MKEIEALGRHFKLAVPENIGNMIRKIELDAKEAEAGDGEKTIQKDRRKKASKASTKQTLTDIDEPMIFFKDDKEKQAYVAWRMFRTKILENETLNKVLFCFQSLSSSVSRKIWMFWQIR